MKVPAKRRKSNLSIKKKVTKRVPKKRIIILLDGTWNSYLNFREEEDTHWSNVQKIRSLIKPNDGMISQIVSYSRGVGTGHYFDKWIGGIFGEGVNEQILDAYMMLCDNYQPKDEIFLFGYSRGAVAARAIANMISECGILTTPSKEAIENAWKYFNSSKEDRAKNPLMANLLKKTAVKSEVFIRFIGVWDSVFGGKITKRKSLLGKRFFVEAQYTFSELGLSENHVLNPIVQHAYHAMSVDEKRKVFEPIPWRKSGSATENQKLEQVWFPGSHANVGGGYADSGLSDISLDWMIRKAKSAGLAFNDNLVKQSVKPDIKSQVIDSSSGWESTGVSDRHITFDDSKFHNEKLHASVLAKYNVGKHSSCEEYNPHVLVNRIITNGDLANRGIVGFERCRVEDLEKLLPYIRAANKKLKKANHISLT